MSHDAALHFYPPRAPQEVGFPVQWAGNIRDLEEMNHRDDSRVAAGPRLVTSTPYHTHGEGSLANTSRVVA